MSRLRVEEILGFLNRSFEGSRVHSLMSNLKDVTEDDWAWTAEGGRSIRDMVRHVAAAKHVYDNIAFGNGTLGWPDVQPRIHDESATMADDIAWLRAGYEKLQKSVEALTDDDLRVERKTHWGAVLPTDEIIFIMVEHDLYHAGEINHLRSRKQGTDYWAGGRRTS